MHIHQYNSQLIELKEKKDRDSFESLAEKHPAPSIIPIKEFVDHDTTYLRIILRRCEPKTLAAIKKACLIDNVEAAELLLSYPVDIDISMVMHAMENSCATIAKMVIDKHISQHGFNYSNTIINHAKNPETMSHILDRIRSSNTDKKIDYQKLLTVKNEFRKNVYDKLHDLFPFYDYTTFIWECIYQGNYDMVKTVVGSNKNYKRAWYMIYCFNTRDVYALKIMFALSPLCTQADFNFCYSVIETLITKNHPVIELIERYFSDSTNVKKELMRELGICNNESKIFAQLIFLCDELLTIVS